jgi:PPOX class probable F420-dependent enzyme
MVFDSGSDADVHALGRLRVTMIAWLTTVTPEGQPQTFPVWYLWEHGEVLIYSDKRAKRNANLAANPRVSIHLDSNPEGGDVIVLEGEARFDPATPPVTENGAYLAKYGTWIGDFLESAEKMAETYNVAIRIRPTRGRHSGG